MCVWGGGGGGGGCRGVVGAGGVVEYNLVSKCLKHRLNVGLSLNLSILQPLLGNSPLKLPYMSTSCASGTAYIWTIWCILGKTVSKIKQKTIYYVKVFLFTLSSRSILFLSPLIFTDSSHNYFSFN